MIFIERILHFLQVLCTIGAAWFIFIFVAIALLSINYPYNLEWMEGQSIDIVQRIIEGKSLYVKPSIEYVPFIYPPLYFYVSAASALIFGVDFFAARLVSLLSALGIGVVIFCWIRKEGGNRRASLIATGLFYATYELSSRWFDIARIDSLYVFLVVAALYVLMHHRSVSFSIFAGILLALAFFTKQNAVLAAFPILLAGLFLDRKTTSITLSVFLIISGISILFFNNATDGWFNYYIFELPASHHIDKKFITGFWINDILLNLWPLVILCVAGWFAIWKADKRKAIYYLALAAGLVGAAYAGRLHRYGWTNVLIPAHFNLSLCAVISIVQWLRDNNLKNVMAGYALILLQFALLIYNPVYNIPSHDAIRQGDEFMKKIASIEGEIFMPEIQFISSRVGKKSYTYGLASIDVFQSNTSRNYARDDLRREINQAIAERRFAAIISSGLIHRSLIERHYYAAENLSYPRKMLSGYQPSRRLKLMLPIK